MVPTKTQLSERSRAERAKQLRLLADAVANASPVYVVGAAGFWLEKIHSRACEVYRLQFPVSSRTDFLLST